MGGGPGARGGILVQRAQRAVDHQMQIVVGQRRREALVGEIGDDGGRDGFGDGGIEVRPAQQAFEVGAEDRADVVAGRDRNHFYVERKNFAGILRRT